VHLNVCHQSHNGCTIRIDQQWLRAHDQSARTTARLATLRAQTFIDGRHEKLDFEPLFHLIKIKVQNAEGGAKSRLDSGTYKATEGTRYEEKYSQIL
jgi:hypothetical protein